MSKLTITLVLTDAEANTLMETLDIGANHRHTLEYQRYSNDVKKYIGKRIGAAEDARHRTNVRNQRREELDNTRKAVLRALLTDEAAKADKNSR